jgi:hypothetical protein
MFQSYYNKINLFIDIHNDTTYDIILENINKLLKTINASSYCNI